MHCSDVVVEIAPLPAAEIARVTGKRFCVQVNERMPIQLGLDPETLVANAALEAFLPSVDANVARQLLLPAKTLSAVHANVREIVGVELGVRMQRRLRLEAIAARVADVRPLARVRSQMVFPRPFGSEAHATNRASKALYLEVNVLDMSAQSCREVKSFSTHVTRERSIVPVDPQVTDQHISIFE